MQRVEVHTGSFIRQGAVKPALGSSDISVRLLISEVIKHGSAELVSVINVYVHRLRHFAHNRYVLVLRKQILNQKTNKQTTDMPQESDNVISLKHNSRKKKDPSTAEIHQALIRHAHKIARRRKTTKNKRYIRTGNIRWQMET